MRKNRIKKFLDKASADQKTPVKKERVRPKPETTKPNPEPTCPEGKDTSPPREVIIPKLEDIRFPCLMIEQSKQIVIFSNANGVGIVLDKGQSSVLRNGDVILWVQRWFHYESLTFVPMPEGSKFTFCNLFSF